MRHKFTPEERQCGGWARARQKADWRRAHPTDAEQAIRQSCNRLGYAYATEYEIWNEFGPYPQWLDVYLCNHAIAIEIDGSHHWHDPRYPSSKMYDYDQAKRLWCEAHNVRLVVLHDWFYAIDEMDNYLHDIIECATELVQSDDIPF